MQTAANESYLYADVYFAAHDNFELEKRFSRLSRNAKI
jgi:hypothetical protein